MCGITGKVNKRKSVRPKTSKINWRLFLPYELTEVSFKWKAEIFGEINASKTTTKKINKEKAETSEPQVASLLKKWNASG